MRIFIKIVIVVVSVFLIVNLAVTPASWSEEKKLDLKKPIAMPRIVVESVSVKGMPLKSGDPVDLGITFKNKGNKASSSGLLYKISCKVLSGGPKCPVPVTTRTLNKSIGPGMSHPVKLAGTIPASAGKYEVSVGFPSNIREKPFSLQIEVKPKPQAAPGGKTPVIKPKAGQKPVPRDEPSGESKAMKFKGGLTISPITLMVKLLSGDFEKWGTEWKDTAPQNLQFRWKTSEVGSPVQSIWEISKSPAFDNPIKGIAGITPAQGRYQHFSIDFKKIQSYAKSDTFYVRVAPPSDEFTPSLPVKVSIIEPGPVTFFSTKGLHPELWNPVPIRVNVGNLHIVRADEDDDEEPYIIMMIIYADGTSIDLLNMGNSSIRMHSTHKTHGNVWSDGDLGTGDNPGILEGPWDTTILPVGLNALELIESNRQTQAPSYEVFLNNTFVAVLVVAMEEDATATGDADSIKNTLETSLRNEINSAIRGMNVNLDTDPSDIQGQFLGVVDKVMKTIQSKIGEIAKNNLLMLPFSIGELTDPDDKVGTRYQLINYQQIINAGASGVKIPMDFNSCDGCDAHYSLQVTVSKR